MHTGQLSVSYEGPGSTLGWELAAKCGSGAGNAEGGTDVGGISGEGDGGNGEGDDEEEDEGSDREGEDEETDEGIEAEEETCGCLWEA